MSYYVPDGNWTSNVANSLGNTAVDVLTFTPKISPMDPAPGCEKTFTANYSCGLGGTAKTVSVAKPADGKTARFDCAAEFAKCNDLKLTLTDDGKLTLTNFAGTTKLWSSVDAFGANGAFPANSTEENAPIPVPKHAGNGIPNSAVDVVEGGGPGRRYPFNYLLSGQFLEPDQWIGSPSGTCRLMMGTNAEPNSLQVVKSVLNCDSLDTNTPAVVATVPAATDAITGNIDNDAARLYTIPPSHVENIGKAGHVDNLGQLRLYPKSMTSYTNNYEKIGSYQTSGGILKSFTGSSLEDCQDKCTSGNYPDGTGDTQKCAGFVFDTTSARCNLVDNTIYKQNQIIRSTANYYMREKGIIKQDISCPAEIIIQNATFWNDFEKNSTPMSPSAKCGMANYTSAQRNKVASDLPNVYANVEYKDENDNLSNNIKYDDVKDNKKLYNKNKNTFKYWVETLQDKYSKLTNKLFTTKTSLNSKLNELQESKQNLADWSGEQLQNLEAMTEDRDLNMMSQNYRHIMWSILAIILIIVTMKMTKAKAA